MNPNSLFVPDSCDAMRWDLQIEDKRAAPWSNSSLFLCSLTKSRTSHVQVSLDDFIVLR